MKKMLTALLILVIAGIVGWFLLFRPEEISQDTLTQDFETNRKAYEDVAHYLIDKHITTEIRDIPIAGQQYEGVVYEQSDEYGAFMDGIYVIMRENHDAILSDGKTVEFIYHSTGGAFTRLYGSVIYNGERQVGGKVTAPLTTDGWHLYLTQE